MTAQYGEPAIFISRRKAEVVANQARSVCVKEDIPGSVSVHPHFEDRCMKGFKVHFKPKNGNPGFAITEAMMKHDNMQTRH